jgi:uncharacterized damage-inducible protein DinB
MYKFLISAVRRHLKETIPIIEQLTEVDIWNIPFPEGREIGEVVLHMVRSLEFYMKGITTNQWEFLSYSLDEYDSAEAIIELAKDVFKHVEVYTSLISSTDMERKVRPFNMEASIAQLIMEMLEHSIHHRGQMTTYLRLSGVSPVPIEYII